jgi:hypothetical protein
MQYNRNGSAMAVVLYLVCIVLCGCTKNRLKFVESKTLEKTEEGSLVVETYRNHEVLGLPVWTVKKGTTLFTVERVFQESEPGFPELAVSGTNRMIQDANRSYVYSIEQGKFLINKYPASVYIGEYGNASR